MRSASPYEVLGVDRTATPAQIKRAYVRLAKTAHPDAGGSSEKFVRIGEAYAILSDPERRQRYDTTGDTAPTPRDPTRDNALSVVANILANMILGEPEPKDLKLLDILRDAIQKQIDEITAALSIHERAKRRVDTLRGRFSRVKTTDEDKENMLEAILRSHVDRIEQATKALSARRDAFQYAQTMLADYEFTEDAPVVMQRLYTARTGTSATGMASVFSW